MKILFLTIITLILGSTSYVSSACECVVRNFNSKDDLVHYEFIALVKIDSIFSIENSNEDAAFNQNTFGINFKISELYKGRPFTGIQVNGGHHSLNNESLCGLGVDVGEEWLIFAYKTKVGVIQTGYCTNSIMYRDEFGKREWFYQESLKRINKLREIFEILPDVDKHRNGLYQEFYKNGNLEVASNYQNGILNGVRKVYYADGGICRADSFLNGKLQGTSYWYYDDQVIFRRCKYEDGLKIDSCIFYYPDGQPKLSEFYLKNEFLYESKEFGIGTNIKSITEEIPLLNRRRQCKYNGEGNLFRIYESDFNGYSNSITIEIYENGQIEGIWEDFEKGEIASETKKYSEAGDLIFHRQTLRDGTRVEIVNKE